MMADDILWRTHDCLCPEVDPTHRSIICLYRCGGSQDRFLAHLSDAVTILEPNYLTVSNPQWTKSFIWHDIARYVFGDDDLFERCCRFLGTTGLNSLYEGLTPLAVGIRSNNTRFVHYFTTAARSSNVNFNIKFSPKSQTYLHLAALAGNPEVIRYIILRFRLAGFEKMIDFYDDEGKNAYDICVQNGNEEAANQFRTFPSSKSSVHNVLLVGVSQSGKSTLVKYLHEYNGQTASNVIMGDGLHSCTSSCNNHRLQFKNKEFYVIPRGQPKDGRKANIRVLHKTSTSNEFELQYTMHESSSNVIGLYEKNLDIHEVEFINRQPVSINLIDTPGIGDDKDKGDGVDEQNIIRILEYLQTNKISQLHAIFFIVKPALLTSPLKEKICYYFKMFNRDIGSIYVIFTHYSKKDRKRDLKHNVNITEQRLEFLRECDSRATQDIDDRDHVMEFLNNVEISTLFRTVVSFDRFLDVSSIKFVKTQNMKNAEMRVLQYIEGRRAGAESGVKQFDATAARYLAQIEAKQLKTREAEIKKKDLDKDIRDKDSDQIVDICTRQYIDDWYWFYSRPDKNDKFESKFPITHYDAVTQSSVEVKFSEESNQSSEMKSSGNDKLFLVSWVVKSKWWTKQDALVRIFTQSRYYYEEVIKNDKKDLLIAEIALRDCREELQEVAKEANENSKHIAELTKSLEEYTKATLFLNASHITIAQYQRLKAVYHSSEIGEAIIKNVCDVADMSDNEE
ncbi:hypothetical protein HDU82_007335 [Entophlyctis luteolus]|nr:hypothetical protein HDU82_007335 [Entophlyctis luteolus]